MNERKRQQGFSLTELLVAVAVGSLVIMGVYQVFMNSLSAFQSQQEVGQIQFNAKAVISFMRGKIANAGSGVPTDVPIQPIVFQNNAGGISPRYLLGADALQIRTFGNVGEPMIIRDYNNPSKVVRLEQPNSVDTNERPKENTSVGNLLLVWKPGINNYALVEITKAGEVASGGSGTGNDTQVNFSPGLSIYNTPDGLGEDYSGGVAIMIDQNAMETLTFFVDANRVLRMVDGYYNIADPADANNQAALPLLDEVEDFQVQLGFDDNDDNAVDAWTFSDAGRSMNNLLAVKCFVLARARNTDRFASGIRRPDIDTADGVDYPDAPDDVRRRLYSFTVQLRNRLD